MAATIKKALFVLVCLGAVLWRPANVHARWQTLKTDSFVIFYLPGWEDEAWDLLGALHDCLPLAEELTGNTMGRVPVVIQDMGISSNGIADPVYLTMHIFPHAPGHESALGYCPDWFGLVGVHEMTHLLHLTAASGAPRVLRSIFGPVLGPVLHSPAWLAEGIAVYAESASHPYAGRLNDGEFDEMIRAMAEVDKLPSLARATFSEEEYPWRSARYLYGAAFVRYLAETYGAEGIAELIDLQAGSLLSYLSPVVPAVGMDRYFEQVYGVRLPQLWEEWRTHEREAAGTTSAAAVRVTHHGGTAGSPIIHDSTLYYRRSGSVRLGPHRTRWIQEIVALDPSEGEQRRVVRTPSGFLGSMVVQNSILYYAVGEFEAGHDNIDWDGFGYTAKIRALNQETGRERTLVRDALRCFTVTPAGDVYYARDRVDGPGSQLLRLGRDGGDAVLVGESTLRIYEVAPVSGGLILSAAEPGHNPDLYFLGVDHRGMAPPRPLTRSAFSEETVLVHDRTVFYSANPEGVHSLYSLDLDTGLRTRHTGDGYAAAPAYDPVAGLLYYTGITAAGEDLFVVEAAAGRPDQAPDAVPLEPPPRDLDRREVERGGYADNLRTLLPKVRIPFAAYNGVGIEVGVLLDGETALHDLGYRIEAGYDFGASLPWVSATATLSFVGPLSLDLGYTTAENHTLGATIRLPVMSRAGSGISSLGVTLRAVTKRGFSRTIFTPGISVGFRSPVFRGYISTRVPVERTALLSSLDRVGVLLFSSVSVAVLGAHLEVDLGGYWDPQGVDPVLPPIRGYQVFLTGGLGGTARIRFSGSLLRIRDGFWNPTVYFGDLFAGVFTQIAGSDTGELHLSFGVEAVCELKLFGVGGGLPVDLGGWIGLDRDLAFVWGLTGNAFLPVRRS